MYNPTFYHKYTIPLPPILSSPCQMAGENYHTGSLYTSLHIHTCRSIYIQPAMQICCLIIYNEALLNQGLIISLVYFDSTTSEMSVPFNTIQSARKTFTISERINARCCFSNKKKVGKEERK